MKVVLPRGEKEEILKDALLGERYAKHIINVYKELCIYQDDPDHMKRFEDALESWRHHKSRLRRKQGEG